MNSEESVFIREVTAPGGNFVFNLDSISSTLTLKSEVSQGRGEPGPGKFGDTAAGVGRLDDIRVRYTPRDRSVEVTASAVITATWRVRSETGPVGQVDIADENDPDITAANYRVVAADLSPDISDLNGRPPRDQFWAEDLTEKHELFHTKQIPKELGPEVTETIKKSLDSQTVTPPEDGNWAPVMQPVLQQALNEGKKDFYFLSLAREDQIEKEAYGDGAPYYRERSNAIFAKGYALGYVWPQDVIKTPPPTELLHTR
jgi:hypothetical protein